MLLSPAPLRKYYNLLHHNEFTGLSEVSGLYMVEIQTAFHELLGDGELFPHRFTGTFFLNNLNTARSRCHEVAPDAVNPDYTIGRDIDEMNPVFLAGIDESGAHNERIRKYPYIGKGLSGVSLCPE